MGGQDSASDTGRSIPIALRTFLAHWHVSAGYKGRPDMIHGYPNAFGLRLPHEYEFITVDPVYRRGSIMRLLQEGIRAGTISRDAVSSQFTTNRTIRVCVDSLVGWCRVDKASIPGPPPEDRVQRQLSGFRAHGTVDTIMLPRYWPNACLLWASSES
ncbi:hypothetical protein C8Q78DRAFT_994936 [Trametes maxima]|nr:hypothetical protein C8Q78DRAFT_994936 [Trametes maxima]